MMNRISLTALGVLVALTSTPASGQDNYQGNYPSRVVRMVVPFPPGSGTDLLSRLITDQLARKWNASVITENVPGASGNIGAADVFRSAPDGHTLLLCPPGPIATNKFLFKDLAYDSTRWVPISWLTTVPYVLITRTNFAGDFKALMAHAKANPGKVTAAMPGPGGTAHLSAAYLESVAGIKLVHVPYRGEAPAVADVLARQIALTFNNVAVVAGHVKSGALRALAVTSPKRLELLPDVPTMAEAGVPDVEVETWFALTAPKATPREIVRRLNAEVVKALAMPDLAKRYDELAIRPAGGSPDIVDAMIKSEVARWSEVIRRADIKLATY
jgi:tripartite-type tricarboxylate transporter receptor subunit TctC